MSTINIEGLDKAAVLAALFNASRQQGMGVLDRRGAVGISVEEARTILEEEGPYFDYLRGRVMKIAIEGDEIEPRLYDRDNGQGAAEYAINSLRAK